MSETGFEEGPSCPICLEALLQRPMTTSNGAANESFQIGTTVPCGHCFHTTCWNRSISHAMQHRRPNVNKCPTCNGTTFSFMRLYLNTSGAPSATESNVAQRSPSSETATLPQVTSRHGWSFAQGSFTGTSQTANGGVSNPSSAFSMLTGSSMAAHPRFTASQSQSGMLPHASLNGASTTATHPARSSNQVPATETFPSSGFSIGTGSSRPAPRRRPIYFRHPTPPRSSRHSVNAAGNNAPGSTPVVAQGVRLPAQRRPVYFPHPTPPRGHLRSVTAAGNNAPESTPVVAQGVPHGSLSRTATGNQSVVPESSSFSIGTGGVPEAQRRTLSTLRSSPRRPAPRRSERLSRK